MEKMKLQTLDISHENIARLQKLFPECVTEVKDKDGNIRLAVDFKQLKSILGETVAFSKERFGLHWPGKAECMRIIQQTSIATLKPNRGESINFDQTENSFIEGDNLEVLKLLQKSYFGKVKMIYIDPPYNTGKEFIYIDKYSETLDTYLEYTDQKDSKGRRFSTNTDTQGRYHSNWLNMMYPRLYIAKNLLREDGVIFISIDDNEVNNLREIGNQIFGEENFVAQFVWSTKKGAQGMTTSNMVVTNHEYITVYARNIAKFKFLGLERTDEGFSNPDNDSRGLWKRQYLQRLGQNLPIRQIKNPKTDHIYRFETPYTQNKIDKWISEKRIIFPKQDQGYPARKEFLSEYANKQQLITNLELYSTKSTTEKLYKLFGNIKIFTNPKPDSLIFFLLKTTTTKNDIILDFFAGSATTAHAVMQLNAEDGGNRKYIMVQLPEPTDKKSEAYKAGYKTISNIGKERIRRAAKKIQEENPDYQDDLGFKVFKLSQSNFKVWEGNVEKMDDLGKQLQLHINHINPDSSSEDILYEILLKFGFPLTAKIEKIRLARKDVFSIEGGAMMICLDKKINRAVIDAIAKTNPSQVIFLDEGFKGNDQLKANAVQTFKSLAQAKVFRTV